MRLPNSYGSISKLSGNRRRPYMVRLTVGWTAEGKRISKVLDYYETRKKALQALAEYHANPYSLEEQITFAELFEKFKKEKFGKISKSNQNGYMASFKTSKKLHDMPFVEIKTAHMQKIVDTCGKGHGTLRKLKVLYKQLYAYAIANDLTDKDYAKYVNLPANTEKTDRKPFTDAEIASLWERQDYPYVSTALILLYTGMRIGELLDMETKNVHLDEKYMIGGNKTESGKGRIIALNDKIIPLVKEWYDKGYPYLISNPSGGKMLYHNYKDYWKKIMADFQMEHGIHDTRHDFVSRMYQADVPDWLIKKQVGHSGKNVTEKTYLHVDLPKLLKAVNKI